MTVKDVSKPAVRWRMGLLCLMWLGGTVAACVNGNFEAALICSGAGVSVAVIYSELNRTN